MIPIHMIFFSFYDEVSQFGDVVEGIAPSVNARNEACVLQKQPFDMREEGAS